MTLKEFLQLEQAHRIREEWWSGHFEVVNDHGVTVKVAVKSFRFFNQILQLNDNTINHCSGHTLKKVSLMHKHLTDTINSVRPREGVTSVVDFTNLHAELVKALNEAALLQPEQRHESNCRCWTCHAVKSLSELVALYQPRPPGHIHPMEAHDSAILGRACQSALGHLRHMHHVGEMSDHNKGLTSQAIALLENALNKTLYREKSKQCGM